MRDSKEFVVMVGPSLASRGGIASLCGEYERAGIFERQRVVYLASYVSGGVVTRAYAAARCALQLLVLLLRGRVALLHVHVASGTSLWRKTIYCAMAAVARVPYVLHLHSGKLPDYIWQRCGPLRRKMFGTLLRRSAVIVVLSRERVDWVRRRHAGAVPIEVLPNFVRAPAQRRVPPAHCQLVFMGRLEEAKGVSMLIRAFGALVARFPQTTLVLAGEGDASPYHAQAAALGVADAVRFVGWVEGEAKAALLCDASVFVLPSRFEGLPMAVLEAMSLGVPCVATAVGGLPDLIRDRVNGRLVAMDDAEGLAAALIELVGDEALREAMGRAGRATVESHFSAAAVEEHLARIYATVRQA